MEIKKITDPAFRRYGRIITDVDFTGALDVLRKETPCPMDGTVYVASEPKLEAVPQFDKIRDRVYGEMPIQIGYCNGFNKKLNALEYHRDSEINVPADDVILILGLRADVTDDMTYDTSKCEAFLIPKGTAVEVFATTLHYAPCSPAKDGFRVIVILPRGTNTDLHGEHGSTGEDAHLTNVNKWLLGHPEGVPAGSPLGLVGENLSVD